MLAMKKHIGYSEGLTRVDWRYLIYEGEEDEPVEKACRNVADAFPDATLIAHESYQDGDSPPRPIVLLQNDRNSNTQTLMDSREN